MKKKLENCNKEELIDIIKEQRKELNYLNKIYHKAIRYSASLRHVLITEFTTNKGDWETITEDIAEEEEIPTPPDFKEFQEPQMKSKKKETEVGYS